MTRKIFQYVGIIFLLGSFFNIAYSAVAAAKQETIENFQSIIVVNIDNSVDVTETILYTTGSLAHHGIFRAIRTLSSEGKLMAIKNISVVDSNGSAYQFEVVKSNEEVNIKIGDLNTTFTGEKTYILHYQATNAVAHLDDRDEIYWNVTGDAWGFPILTAGATVILPSNTHPTTSACYYGVTGENTHCDVGDEPGLAFKALSELLPNQGLTIAVGFPKGIIAAYAPKSFLQQYGVVVIALMLPIFLFIFLYLRWKKYGRDPKGTGVIVAEYDVPEGLTPMEVGVIMAEKSRTKDISAELIYLATKGYLKIRETDNTTLGFIHTKDYELTLLKDPKDLTNDFDKTLLAKIFVETIPDQTMRISNLKNKFFMTIPALFDSVRKSMLSKMYYTHLPTKTFSLSIGIIPFVLYVSFIIVISVSSGSLPISSNNFLILAVSIIVSVTTFIIFEKLMPAKTDKGVKTKEYLLGLKEYLQIAEKDRLTFHNAPEKKPELFEELLPYALVLGVENSWAKEFQDMYTESPRWYEGTHAGPFNALIFSKEIAHFSAVTSSSFMASPNSSGGSGGGGFSGGGGGGGGGGSW